MLKSLFHKVADMKAHKFIKKRLQHRCFLVNSAEFLRTPISKNISERLLLFVQSSTKKNNKSEAWPRPGQTLEMENFSTIVNDG